MGSVVPGATATLQHESHLGLFCGFTAFPTQHQAASQELTEGTRHGLILFIRSLVAFLIKQWGPIWYRIIEQCGLEWTLKGHLVQPYLDI